MKSLEKKFKKLLENNKDKDWNNLTFRQTITDAFRYCAEKHFKELHKSHKEGKK